MLMRKDSVMNLKKLRRLYTEEQLQVRKCLSRHLLRNCLSGNGWSQKSPWHAHLPMAIPQGPNQRWLLDFVSDMFCHRRLRILTVVDDFTRECVALVADTLLQAYVWLASWTPPLPSVNDQLGLFRTAAPRSQAWRETEWDYLTK